VLDVTFLLKDKNEEYFTVVTTLVQCIPNQKGWLPNERDVLKKYPTLKPSQVQSALLFSLLWEGESWDKIDKEASKLVDRKWISNQKQAVRTQSPGRKR
jgi:hypothetical protein